jgi:hypothetical protein
MPIPSTNRTKYGFLVKFVPAGTGSGELRQKPTLEKQMRYPSVYLPKENQFTIQSDGSAEMHLRKLKG